MSGKPPEIGHWGKTGLKNSHGLACAGQHLSRDGMSTQPCSLPSGSEGLHQEVKVFNRKGLGNQLANSRLFSALLKFFVDKTRSHGDRKIGSNGSHFSGDFQSLHPRHVVVGYNDMKVVRSQT